MTDHSLEEIEARLAELERDRADTEAERRRLLRVRRPKVAGTASGKSRQQSRADRNEKIRATYIERVKENCRSSGSRSRRPRG